MNSIFLKSPAKINLYLKILKKRADGYHQIETIFEKIGICDTIFLKKRKNGILVKCDKKEVPAGPSNLAYKAALLLKERLSLPFGVEIKIKKQIPIASGLGGASSNAAAVLNGMNRLFRLGLSQDYLVELARQLGADVPFFLYPCKMAFGEEKGDKICPVQNSQPFWFLVVTPNIRISTKKAYQLWDRNKRLNLTHKQRSAKILLHALKNKDWKNLENCLFNDFESIIGAKYNIIYDIKKALQDNGAKAASMSGSGSSVFGIFTTRKGARRAREALSCNKKWQTFMTKTYR